MIIRHRGSSKPSLRLARLLKRRKMRPATVLCLCLATARAFTRPHLRRAPTVRRQAVDVNALPFYTVAETGAGADDPFLLSLAGASIGLFIFVVGGAAYLTFQEQQSKKSIEEEDTKPRLPTLAELEAEGVRDEAALMNAADMPAATNRNERRQNKKLLKKRVEPQQDRARF